MILGIIILAIGVVFLLKNLGVIAENTWDIIWPVVLIAIGLKLTLRKRTRPWFSRRRPRQQDSED
jgi:hypothetical protein